MIGARVLPAVTMYPRFLMEDAKKQGFGVIIIKLNILCYSPVSDITNTGFHGASSKVRAGGVEQYRCMSLARTFQ